MTTSRQDITEPDARVEWQIEQHHSPGRVTYTILREGWVIAEFYCGSDGWRQSHRPMEMIPAHVMSELPPAGRNVLVQVAP